MLIETERLQLRFLSKDDVEDVLIYQGDPDSVRYIPWEPRSREEVLDALARAETSLGLASETKSLLLAVVLKTTGQVIGQLNSAIVDPKNFTANIGYALNREFRGKGYVNEALVALLDDIFTNHEVMRVIADIDIRNSESIKVVEKLGFRREATFIENDWCKGEWCSMHLYALLSREWPSK
jgi:RimJ/RimL family protein N-acetyltransferase